MLIKARGGTDAAGIVLFWPELLPDDAGRQLKEDPITLVEQMAEAGKLIWFPCDSDGGYAMSIHVDASIPDDVLEVCTDHHTTPALTVRGDGYFGGIEWQWRSADAT